VGSGVGVSVSVVVAVGSGVLDAVSVLVATGVGVGVELGGGVTVEPQALNPTNVNSSMVNAKIFVFTRTSRPDNFWSDNNNITILV
jgi:hypothetical protein